MSDRDCMVRHMRLIAGTALLAAFAVAGCSGASSSSEQAAGSATAASVPSSASASSTPSRSAPPVLATNSDHLLKGDAHPTFPAGQAGKVDVVAIGPFDRNLGSGTLPVVFRNNTAHAISHVDLTATARRANGKVVGSGSSQDVVPAQVQPGEVAFAYIFFQSAKGIPSHGTRYSFSSDTSPADTSSFNTAPIKITQANHVGGAIVGTGVNDTGKKVTGPYGVDVFCFQGNHVTRVETDFANEDGDLKPGAPISYSVSLYGDSCSHYLVGSSGFFN
jgi:hypothetical protein